MERLTRASSDEQRTKDFLTKLGAVGHVRHPNVSALLGCCVDRDLHLIFEFSSRGSGCSNLYDESSPPMAWKLRHDIAVGTAMGLHYLHKGCQRRIIHRDIKASNILLTANFEPQVASSTQLTSLLLLLSICTTNPSPPPQISDFGLARWLPTEWTHRFVARAPIEGTFRYELLENIHAGAQGLRCSQQLTKLVVSPGAWRRNTSCTGSFTRRPMWLHFASSSWRSCQEGNQWMDLTTACSAGSASAASDGHRDHYGTAIANFVSCRQNLIYVMGLCKLWWM
ncbi:hypothetical protein BHM03_00006286 [Ensete ventricosum]|nr:hypothetical protein BHM03_00006286 [Ensete ventricosum]